jgi:hypothetical protein
MPQISVAENPALAQKMLREVQNNVLSEPPDLRPATDTVFSLCGGYAQLDGKWVKEFEVRELTGRDEEYIGRIAEPTRVFVAILERGLVRVGNEKSSSEVVDGLLAGDWETVLIAIRIATFGWEYETEIKCRNCGHEHEVSIDLRSIPFRNADKEDYLFDVVGRKGTRYQVCMAYGSTQRKIMGLGVGTTQAEINTVLLADCIQSVNGMPPLGPDSVRDIPMSDRRLLLKEIEARRAGPRFREVTTKCPACDAEQESVLSIAAMFR